MAALLRTTSDPTREDISDDLLLYDEGRKTPLLAQLAKGERPDNSEEFSWVVERVGNTATNGVRFDGQNVTTGNNNAANRKVVKARCTLQGEPVEVGTKALHGQDRPGIGKEEIYNHELMLAGKRLQQMIEKEIIGTQDSAPEVAGTSGTRMRGLTNWCRSANPGSPDLPMDALVMAQAAQIIVQADVADITVAALESALQKAWERTGEMGHQYSVFCTASMQTRINQYFSNVPTVSGKTSTLMWNGDIKESNYEVVVTKVSTKWGTLDFVPHNFMPSDVHFLGVPMKKVKIRPIYGMEHAPLNISHNGKAGDIESFYGIQPEDPALLIKGVAA
jgi:hypothetical protein